MATTNRLIQTNGQTQGHKLPLIDEHTLVTQKNAAEKVQQILREHPGTLILVGLAVGGLLGWLTSRRIK